MGQAQWLAWDSLGPFLDLGPMNLRIVNAWMPLQDLPDPRRGQGIPGDGQKVGHKEESSF